jgi:DNA-directed RNA polymerase specialized sigma subunit
LAEDSREGYSDEELFVRARAGDVRARERLAERYLPLARRQAEIGERIGVSQMQVSRLIRHALIRLCAGLIEHEPLE